MTKARSMWVKFEENAPVLRAVLGPVKQAEIVILDLSDQIVHRATLPAQPAGAFNGESYYDYAWDGPKSKGVYYAEVKGESDEGTVHAKTKFAVVG